MLDLRIWSTASMESVSVSSMSDEEFTIGAWRDLSVDYTGYVQAEAPRQSTFAYSP